MTLKLGVLATHPIQYHSPLYRELAARPDVDLTVYFAHRASARDQAAAGFGVDFEWDVPLLEGYAFHFLENVSSRPNTSSSRGCDTPEIAQHIRKERFDAFLVHGWYNRSYRQAIRACWGTQTPVMVRGDSNLIVPSPRIRRIARWFTHRWLIPRFDAYLVVGQRTRDYYLHFGADPARMEFCPHCIDNDRFARKSAAARENRVELRQRWGLLASDTVFIFSGKLVARKRVLDFVNAVGAARERGLAVSGLIVGDGAERLALESAVRANGAPVRFAGFLNQAAIPDAYAAADVLVLPSDTDETWGLVVNEAMACGLPAVVSDLVGCGPDLVVPGETGFVYPCGNVRALTDHLALLASDHVLLKRVSKCACSQVSNYSIGAAADGVCRAGARAKSRRPRSH